MIDYFTYTRSMRYAVNNVRVYRSAELSTEHRLLIMKLRLRPLKPRKDAPYERFKVGQLRDEQKKKEYKEQVTAELRTRIDEVRKMESDGEQMELAWKVLKETLLNKTREVCGVQIVKMKAKRTKWWNDHVKGKIKEKKVAWKSWIKDKTDEAWQVYV